jgi:hypothetical protein
VNVAVLLPILHPEQKSLFPLPNVSLDCARCWRSKVNHPLFALAPDDDFPCSKIDVLDSHIADFNQSAAGAVQQFEKSTVAQYRGPCQKPLNLALREDAGQLSWNLSGTNGTWGHTGDRAAQVQKVKERPQASKSVIHKRIGPSRGEIGRDEIRYIQGHNLAKRLCLDVAAESLCKAAVFLDRTPKVILGRQPFPKSCGHLAINSGRTT